MPTIFQGTHKVVERTITMEDILKSIQENRVSYFSESIALGPRPCWSGLIVGGASNEGDSKVLRFVVVVVIVVVEGDIWGWNCLCSVSCRQNTVYGGGKQFAANRAYRVDDTLPSPNSAVYITNDPLPFTKLLLFIELTTLYQSHVLIM